MALGAIRVHSIYSDIRLSRLNLSRRDVVDSSKAKSIGHCGPHGEPPKSH